MYQPTLKGDKMLSRQFLSVKDVADLLKVGETAVRSWIKHSDLRAIDVGREWRIAPVDLEDFLRRHANRPPTNAASASSPPRRDGAQPSFLKGCELWPRE